MSNDTRQALAARDTSKPAEQQGLFHKFEVRRTDGSSEPGGKHHGCDNFVLDVDHDPHAKAALSAYADAVEATHPLLAKNMRARYALSAQPVAGAVAEPDCWAILTPNGSKLVSPDEAKGRKDAYPLYATPQLQAAPAPEPSDEAECEHATIRYMLDATKAEPSAQAVAHPSHQTVREWMPVSEALRLSDLWTAGDLDNCGQWRAAIKVLADEVRALAASPHTEPSAQGEPVAWRPGDPIYDDAYVRGVAVGFAEDDSRRTTLLRIADRIEARASAPSTQPPAVVEAVPLAERWVVVCESVLDVGFGGDVREGGRPELGYALLANATTFDSEDKAKAAIRNAKLPIGWVYMPLSRLLPDLRGIAPKAAQEKT